MSGLPSDMLYMIIGLSTGAVGIVILVVVCCFYMPGARQLLTMGGDRKRIDRMSLALPPPPTHGALKNASSLAVSSAVPSSYIGNRPHMDRPTVSTPIHASTVQPHFGPSPSQMIRKAPSIQSAWPSPTGVAPKKTVSFTENLHAPQLPPGVYGVGRPSSQALSGSPAVGPFGQRLPQGMPAGINLMTDSQLALAMQHQPWYPMTYASPY